MNILEDNFEESASKNMINEEVLTPLYKTYLKILKIKSWLIMFIVIFIIGVLFYNIFIAGKSYPVEEYNTIMNIFITFTFSFIALIIATVFIIFRLKYKVRGKIKVIAQKHAVNSTDLINDFNTIVKNNFGGEGV